MLYHQRGKNVHATGPRATDDCSGRIQEALLPKEVDGRKTIVDSVFPTSSFPRRASATHIDTETAIIIKVFHEGRQTFLLTMQTPEWCTAALPSRALRPVRIHRRASLWQVEAPAVAPLYTLGC